MTMPLPAGKKSRQGCGDGCFCEGPPRVGDKAIRAKERVFAEIFFWTRCIYHTWEGNNANRGCGISRGLTSVMTDRIRNEDAASDRVRHCRYFGSVILRIFRASGEKSWIRANNL